MAKIAILSNANAVIAEKPIPDSALPALRTVYGATNALAAAAILEIMSVKLRQDVRERLVVIAQEAANAAVQAAQQTARDDFDATSWPLA